MTTTWLIPNFALFPPHVIVEERSSTFSFHCIQKIALHALAELAIAIACTAICFPFVATWGLCFEMLAFALVGVGANIILRIAVQIIQKKKSEIVSDICPSNFDNIAAIHTMALIHETGHFTAAKLLFKGTPQIQINPFKGVWTKWSSLYLTRLGGRLGYRHSIFLIFLAGPALALIASSIAFFAGCAICNTHPHASLYLITIGVIPFLEHAFYAISALWTSPNDVAHDFVQLWTFGIHPVVATIAIVSIPVILILGLKVWNHLQDSSIRRNCSSVNI